ncbi:2-methylaconitate cis-trans isomerase PrpF family protein [Pseudooceanicola sp. 200-1SW]|uniref:2-methylaconitate cis-trans isomerase PrpF family protein n=1 Tax=Pseudooceanicola sp. 200-1SW TaxID=3425949 RepID=UPI003D7F520E
MQLKEIPALFMRGGTSNALVFLREDLPADAGARDAMILSAMGSPDPYGRQLDGMGGGISSLSKICILAPPSRADADMDYTFGQVSVGAAVVDYGGNCGNMSSAVGPAAIDLGLIPPPPDGQTTVRIHNTNTGKIIAAHFPVRGGRLDPAGDLAIDGVAGTAAPIRLAFLDPGGTRTGALLPTGRAVETLTLPDGRAVRASLVDAANPCVFVAAADLGKTGTEDPEALEADAGFMAAMEAIRCAGSVQMGLTADLAAAAALPSIPKVAILAAPQDSRTLAGAVLPAGEVSILVRMISMERPHRAVPITGSVCLALACRTPGTLAAEACTSTEGPITIAHPSGTILVDGEVDTSGAVPRALSGSVFRTARKLFTGVVHYTAEG